MYKIFKIFLLFLFFYLTIFGITFIIANISRIIACVNKHFEIKEKLLKIRPQNIHKPKKERKRTYNKDLGVWEIDG